jgi:aminoglycoside phosphotransferase (APT) family kinase protein
MTPDNGFCHLVSKRVTFVRSVATAGRRPCPEERDVCDDLGDSNSLTNDVYAIAAHFGVSREEVTPVPRQGKVNLTVYLGTELILRVPRKRAVEDRLATEAAVIPLVQRAGVPTARLVRYDASRRVADVPYMVLERLHGPTLDEFGYDPRTSVRSHTSLGEVLAAIHEVRRQDTGPIPGVPEPSTLSPQQLVDQLTAAGEVGGTQGRWLMDWFGLLETHLPSETEPVLLHGDVIPSNLMVDKTGQVIAIIDWGSARWGDPVRDFADFPTRALSEVLSGYRAAGRPSCSSVDRWCEGVALEAGTLWWQLVLAMAKLVGGPSTSEARNWAAPRQARLLEILRFLSDTPPSPWPDLLTKTPAKRAARR